MLFSVWYKVFLKGVVEKILLFFSLKDCTLKAADVVEQY